MSVDRFNKLHIMLVFLSIVIIGILGLFYTKTPDLITYYLVPSISAIFLVFAARLIISKVIKKKIITNEVVNFNKLIPILFYVIILFAIISFQLLSQNTYSNSFFPILLIAGALGNSLANYFIIDRN